MYCGSPRPPNFWAAFMPASDGSALAPSTCADSPAGKQECQQPGSARAKEITNPHDVDPKVRSASKRRRIYDYYTYSILTRCGISPVSCPRSKSFWADSTTSGCMLVVWWFTYIPMNLSARF